MSTETHAPITSTENEPDEIVKIGDQEYSAYWVRKYVIECCGCNSDIVSDGHTAQNAGEQAYFKGARPFSPDDSGENDGTYCNDCLYQFAAGRGLSIPAMLAEPAYYDVMNRWSVSEGVSTHGSFD